MPTELSTKDLAQKLRQPIHFLAFGFGAGLSPRAPGTVGTLAAVPIYLLILQLPLWAYLLSVLLFAVAGVYICGYSAKDLGKHDHQSIVWDEIVGFLLTLTAIPYSIVNIVLGFIIFRLFDIVKPWPISYLDRRVTGGLGIMLDDIVAGLFSLAILQTIVFFIQ